MNLLCTCVLELLEMCLYAWNMFLVLHTLQMAGWRGINRPQSKTSRLDREQTFLSAVALDSPVPCHVSRPLARLSGAHRTVRCFSSRESNFGALCVVCPVHTGQSGGFTPDSPVCHQSAGWTAHILISSIFFLRLFWSWVLDLCLIFVDLLSVF
jgi:hypothetical protein